MSANDWSPPTGDFVVPPTTEAIGTLHLRRKFLSAIQRHAPNVLVALRADVLPKYFAALPDLRDAISWAAVDALADQGKANLATLKGSLRSWASRHDIECTWVLGAAYATLIYHEMCLGCTECPGCCGLQVAPGKLRWCDWLLDENFPDSDALRLTISRQGGCRGLETGERTKTSFLDDAGCALAENPDERGAPLPPVLSPPVPDRYIDAEGTCFVSAWGEWNPFFEPWNDFERQAREQFERDLKWYKERLTAAAAALGGIRSPAKRADIHLKWAVKYRCCKETLDNIWRAEDHFSRPSGRWTVHRGIKDVERLLGLPPLRRPPGRRSRRLLQNPNHS